MNKKTLRTILLILIIPLIAEIFIFNFRFWESLTFKKVTGYSVTREANAVTVSGMDAPVKNVLIDRPDSDEVLHLQMILSDEANTDLELSVTEIVPSVEESKYIRIYPDGNVREIKILFDVTECPDASEVNVELNSARPFSIHVFRVLLIAVLVALVLLFRPGSQLYKMPLCGENKRISDRNKIYVLLALASLICLWMLRYYCALQSRAHRSDLHLSGRIDT